VRVLVAKGVGQDERVEPVVFDRGDPVALPRSSGDARGHREDGVTAGVQVLDEDSFGALDGDRQGCPVLGKCGVELG
jgi:hypothetical protein